MRSGKRLCARSRLAMSSQSRSRSRVSPNSIVGIGRWCPSSSKTNPGTRRESKSTKRKREPMRLKEPPWYRSQRHRRHVRTFDCAIKGLKGHVCQGSTVAAHDRNGTDGATGVKPSDFHCFPLCDDLHGGGAHAEQHRLGEKRFEKKYGISIKDWTAQMVRTSPCRREIEEWKLRHKTRGSKQ